jgi:hypothetical protein
VNLDRQHCWLNQTNLNIIILGRQGTRFRFENCILKNHVRYRYTVNLFKSTKLFHQVKLTRTCATAVFSAAISAAAAATAAVCFLGGSGDMAFFGGNDAVAPVALGIIGLAGGKSFSKSSPPVTVGTSVAVFGFSSTAFAASAAVLVTSPVAAAASLFVGLLADSPVSAAAFSLQLSAVAASAGLSPLSDGLSSFSFAAAVVVLPFSSSDFLSFSS